ncbi:MAG: DUF1800 family protein [Hymenobacter sp.]
MNRRAFLAKGSSPAPAPLTDAPALVSAYANQALPARSAPLPRWAPTPAPGARPGGSPAAALPLRAYPRRNHGGGRLVAARRAGPAADGPRRAGPALRVSATDTTGPIGQTWVGQPFDQTLEGAARSLRDWWLSQQLTQGTSLSEQMTLFWHNHFVVEFGDINSAGYGYEYVRAAAPARAGQHPAAGQGRDHQPGHAALS